jgi:hypothetical protein
MADARLEELISNLNKAASDHVSEPTQENLQAHDQAAVELARYRAGNRATGGMSVGGGATVSSSNG